MFLIRFFRFICGYVIFTGKGGFPERFINLCSCNAISLWDTRASDGILSAKTTISGYKRIRTCARKSGMKIRIQKKCGLPFIAAPYLRRKGLFAGLTISFVLIILLSSAVWTIEVSGNEKFTDEQIIGIAEKYGVYPGAFRKNIDLRQIRTDIKSDIDGLNWFSVNIDGCHATLLVSESSGTTEIIDTTKPCNIVSDVSGEVLKIETQSGTPVPSPGSAVAKGDLLISGVSEKADGSAYFVHARGSAVIRTDRKHSIRIPLDVTVKNISEIKKKYSIRIFSVTIPVTPVPECNFLRREIKLLSFRNKTLPIGIVTETYAVNNDTELSLSTTQAAKLAAFLMFMHEKSILKNAQTESKKFDFSSEHIFIQLNATHIIHKRTGIENYFEVEQ